MLILILYDMVQRTKFF